MNSTVQIVETPSRGRCLVAAKALSPGDSVLNEKAVLAFPSNCSESEMCAAIQQSQLSQWLCSPTPSNLTNRLAAFVAEHPTLDGKSLRQLYTNAFYHVDEKGVEHVALYRNISLLNHSCAPNATLVTRFVGEASPASTVITTKPVQPGEEVTIAYRLLLAPREVRQQYFSLNYDFECQCTRCTALNDDVCDAIMSNEPEVVSEDATTSSSVLRRSAKIFDFALHPLRTVFKTANSAPQVDGVQKLVQLLAPCDPWGIMSDPLEEASGEARGTFWKSAVLREFILQFCDAFQERIPIDRVRRCQRGFLMWFFRNHLGAIHLREMLQSIGGSM